MKRDLADPIIIAMALAMLEARSTGEVSREQFQSLQRAAGRARGTFARAARKALGITE